MENLTSAIAGIDWPQVSRQLNEQGYAVMTGILPAAECNALVLAYNNEHYRKTVVMERYRFGLGEYKYFNYPLPALVQQARENWYPPLAAIANGWMDVLKTGQRFPISFEGFQKLCHKKGQINPTPLILKYGKGGFNTLHQDIYGEIFFPIQAALFLSQPGLDYTGGEFVLTQQTPRAQTKAIVLQPKKGDMVFFTSNYRPVPGARGYYRAVMKHGVSEVLEGNRFTLGIIFHDALT